MPNATRIEGFKCTRCKQVFDSPKMADECCTTGLPYDKMINYLFNARPTRDELKGLADAIKKRERSLNRPIDIDTE